MRKDRRRSYSAGQAPLACNEVSGGSACQPIPSGMSEAGVTVTVSEPTIELLVAVMVATPLAMPSTTPIALTVAIASFDDSQTAVFVTSCLLPSLNVPVAASWMLLPTRSDGSAGVSSIEARSGAVTVNVVAALALPEDALISAWPGPTPFASPELLMLATSWFEDVHVANAVISF